MAQVRPRYDEGPRSCSGEVEIQVMATQTNTPLTATHDPLTPTATPVPGFSSFLLSGRRQAINVSCTAETGETRARVIWRQSGHSRYQQSELHSITAGINWGCEITGLRSDVAYEVYVQGYDDNNLALGRTSVKRARTSKDLNV